MSCKKFTCVREGLKIGGIIIYPKKFKKSSKDPLVIVSHGFMGNYLGTKKYAQKFAKDFLNRMEFYGWTKANDELVMILQNAQTLSNAIKLLEADLTHQLVNYNNN